MRLSFLYSGSLVMLGLAGFLLTGASSPTALIPAFFGLIALALALLARSPRRSWSTTALLALAVLALLGTVSSLFQLPAALEGTAERPAAVFSRATMAALTITYLALWAGIRSSSWRTVRQG